MLTVSLAVKAVVGVTTFMLGTSLSGYDFDKNQKELIFKASCASDVSPVDVAYRMHSESRGNNFALRYCVEWESDIRCSRERSYYGNKIPPHDILMNGLDFGLFGLRDAPSFSWRRWYNKKYDVKVMQDNLFNPEFSSTVLFPAVIKEMRKEMGCGNEPYSDCWMKAYNYGAHCSHKKERRKHARRITRKALQGLQVVQQRITYDKRKSSGRKYWVLFGFPAKVDGGRNKNPNDKQAVNRAYP